MFACVNPTVELPDPINVIQRSLFIIVLLHKICRRSRRSTLLVHCEFDYVRRVFQRPLLLAFERMLRNC